VALRWVTREAILKWPKDYRLVHGNINRLRQDIPVNHAWIEETHPTGALVHDYSSGGNLCCDRNAYYEALGVKNVRRYEPEQALILFFKHGHYGPWDEEHEQEG
jgi:hypothetical protein